MNTDHSVEDAHFSDRRVLPQEPASEMAAIKPYGPIHIGSPDYIFNAFDVHGFLARCALATRSGSPLHSARGDAIWRIENSIRCEVRHDCR